MEILDDTIKDSNQRKQEYYIQRRNDKKTLITKFGEVNYQRTYYKNKKDGTYEYLSDAMVGIAPYERMDLSYESELIKESMDNSYHKSGMRASSNTQVTNQTVLNSIRRLGNVENNDAKLPTKKKEVKIIYIEADEDHVAMQHHNNKEIKLIYVKDIPLWRWSGLDKRRFKLD